MHQVSFLAIWRASSNFGFGEQGQIYVHTHLAHCTRHHSYSVWQALFNLLDFLICFWTSLYITLLANLFQTFSSSLKSIHSDWFSCASSVVKL